MSSSTIRFEAEAMALSTYRQESNSLASGGSLISLYQSGGSTGTATATFTGATGYYDVIIGYVDENDGVSTLDVQIGETTFSWTLDQNLGSGGVTSKNLVRRTLASGLSLSEGTSIKLQGAVNGTEFARIDYIEFVPVSTAPAPLRLEAEAMALSTYRQENNSAASGGNLISLYQSGGSTGTASATFTGTTGYYDVVVGYVDENDGASTLNLEIGNTSFSWTLDQNLGSGGVTSKNLVRRTLASGLSLSEGTSIKLQGAVNGTEFARIDYIEFVPIPAVTGTSGSNTLSGNNQNNLLDGLGGNDVLESSGGDDTLRGGAGTDTVSYAGATSAVVVNLATGIGFVSAYGPTLDIMPLGDSITYGVIHGANTESGGYRTELWKNLGADGLNINFVGSLTSGPSTLGDKNHEGHRGYRIDQIAASINTWLDAHKPEAVLLMIGTNDILQDYALGSAPERLSALIDQITTRMPNAQVLVATIPPSSKSSSDAQQVVAFNAALPGMVDSKVAEGKKVSLVNIFDALRPKDLADTIHPTAEGYRKIANTWHDPLLAATGDYDTLSSIENAVGSAYKDRLIGSAGANVLRGGAGQDTLTGGGGADAFGYKAASEGLDTITDFLSDDRFQISAAGFGGGLRAGTPLSTTESATGVFVSGATPNPIGSSANFLYNTSTGLLNFDRDGNGSGAAVAIAMLNGAPSLTSSQFTIVA